MSIGLVTLFMFVSMLGLLAVGLPIAFSLGSVAAIFTLFLWGPDALFAIPGIALAAMTNFVLVALPLFIFMGNVLERSGLADDLYQAMSRWLGPLRGGLAIGTVLIAALFAAMVGVTAVATVTLGLIGIPSMLKRKYNKGIILGSIGAGGALGVLIPPSAPMVVYAFLTGESVGRMFMGGVVPGLVLTALFVAYIGIRCLLQPHMGPALPKEERGTFAQKITSLRAVILPVILVFLVLGSIFTGAATPTEAAALGAAGSLVCAAVYRRLTWKMLKEANYQTLRLVGMVMLIVSAATIFANVYNALGAPDLIQSSIAKLPVSRYVILVGIQITWFILGCLLDPIGIMMITVPVYVPLIKSLGFDPLWFGVLFIVNMEMGYLTPPFGFNLFYLKGVVPPEITMGDIYRSVTPFVTLQAVGLVLCILFPKIITWLPSLMMG